MDVINLGAVTPNVSHPIFNQLHAGSPNPLNLGSVTSYAPPADSDNFGAVNDAVSTIGGVLQRVNLGTVP